jgi:DNA-binding MarR family transcriptional regulator
MGDMAKNALDTLYRRPGFMIRRAHQIAVSLFLEETGALGITNRQFGIMLALKAQPSIDQITVAKRLGLDRSTTGMVLTKLERAGLVGRVVGETDRRKRSLNLTPAGERMLKRLREPARRAQQRVLSAFAPRERKVFLDLLDKFARTFNNVSRVPQVVQGETATLPNPKGRKRRSALS